MGRNVIKVIIATHLWSHWDDGAAVEMLRRYCWAVFHPKDGVRVVHIPQGTTWNNIRVDPRHAYENFGDGTIVFHVGVGSNTLGRGRLDDHRSGCRQTAVELVAEYARMRKYHPEWERIAADAAQDDRGRSTGSCSAGTIVRGFKRAAKRDRVPHTVARLISMIGGDPNRALQFLMQVMACCLLENERVRVAAGKVPIDRVDLLRYPTQVREAVVRVAEVRGFGNVGLIVAGQEVGRSLAARLQNDGKTNCRLVISICTDEPKFAVMVSSRRDGQERLDLVRLGVVRALRGAESERRGLGHNGAVLSQVGDVPGMALFAHEGPDGRVWAIFHGSATTDVPKALRTILSPQEIIDLVIGAVTPEVAPVEAVLAEELSATESGANQPAAEAVTT